MTSKKNERIACATTGAGFVRGTSHARREWRREKKRGRVGKERGEDTALGPLPHTLGVERYRGGR